MPHVSNSKSSLPNSQHSFPIKNSNLISFNSTENNQGLKLSFNPSLLNNNNALNPITVFESNCIPSAAKPIGVIETFQKPTLIGLNNIGSTIYTNSVLQCLSQTHYLTNYFLKKENKDKIITVFL